jgi:DNA mismatch repair ATPase MutS
VIFNGGPREVWYAAYMGYDDDSTIQLGWLGKQLRKVPCLDNKFDPDGDWLIKTRAHRDPGVDPSLMPDPRRTATLKNLGSNIRPAFNATVLTAGLTAWRMLKIWENVRSAVSQINHIFVTMTQLRVHIIHAARMIRTARQLHHHLAAHPVLSSSYMTAHLKEVLDNPTAELKELFEVLERDTFAVENARSQLFSRGNVLLAHRLFQKNKDALVPLLQGIAELDAVYAMVTNMKERACTATPFSFVEFVPQAQALIELEGGWLPLVREPVPNTITFGGDKPNKIIVTGPNGGGKSVLLKELGVAATMAQSWGVGPAKQIRMTLFNGLRTCIHPEESLEHELSTFMAEKMRIDAIKRFVFTNHHNPHFKVMLLLDEPFRGTVDAESADRIYGFGKDIAALPQSIVLIATHVEKPVKLAEDTNGAFANYHVTIKELPNGTFERSFGIEPGILKWWFDDPLKRSRFVDFVTMEKHKEDVARAIETQQTAVAA